MFAFNILSFNFVPLSHESPGCQSSKNPDNNPIVGFVSGVVALGSVFFLYSSTKYPYEAFCGSTELVLYVAFAIVEILLLVMLTVKAMIIHLIFLFILCPLLFSKLILIFTNIKFTVKV